jgi:hypothetical protein
MNHRRNDEHDEISHDVALLASRLVDGDLDETESRALEGDAELRQLVERTARRMAHVRASLTDHVPVSSDDAAVQIAAAMAASTDELAARRRRSTVPGWLVGAAAAVGLGIVGVGVLGSFGGGDDTEPMAAAPAALEFAQDAGDGVSDDIVPDASERLAPSPDPALGTAAPAAAPVELADGSSDDPESSGGASAAKDDGSTPFATTMSGVDVTADLRTAYLADPEGTVGVCAPEPPRTEHGTITVDGVEALVVFDATTGIISAVDPNTCGVIASTSR